MGILVGSWSYDSGAYGEVRKELGVWSHQWNDGVQRHGLAGIM